MKRTILSTTLVIMGAVIVTALSIDAADTLRGRSGTLLSSVVNTNEGGCPRGMITIDGTTMTCVDMFENSASDECPHAAPVNALDSKENIDTTSCGSVSREAVLPWTSVTREQARVLCARRGSRLPTNAEWYEIALGAQDSPRMCNTDSTGPTSVGSYEECRTNGGVYDLIGNVWEWTVDDVIEGEYNGRQLPESGYVAQVDQAGVAVVSSENPDEGFYQDYIWSNKVGAFGILRGGFYGSRTDAGVYTVHAETLPTTAGGGIGFRCVQ